MMTDSDDGAPPPDTHTIVFQPGSVSVSAVPDGETLLRAADRAGVFIPSACAGAGSCGKCVVRVESGSVRADPSAKIAPADWERGVRLACTSRVVADAIVYVPHRAQADRASEEAASTLSRSIVPDRPAIAAHAGPTPAKRRRATASARPGAPSFRTGYLEAVDHAKVAGRWEVDPPVRAVELTLRPPSTVDRTSDLGRFRESLVERLGGAPIVVPKDVLQVLPSVLRAGNWTVTAVVQRNRCGWEVATVRSGSDLQPLHIAAIDLGTTTVWGQLFDAVTGRVLASSAVFNRQIQYGEDVISRMVRATEPGGKQRLQSAAADSIVELLGRLLAGAGVTAETVYHLVLAGNTTMTCLFMGVDTVHLRLEPYIAPLDRVAPVMAGDFGLSAATARGATLQVLPLVGSYIGGDVVAGVLASDMAERDELSLYLDIGTNGEVVLGNREWLLAASCSAGPAFEGGGLQHGMRATAGAVESVVVDAVTFEVGVLTVEDEPPLGVCGSGAIDAVAELLAAGILLPDGRFDPASSAPGLRRCDGRLEFVLVPAEFSGNSTDIVLTESDVDNVIRAKAAMFAGVSTLLRTVGLDWTDLERIVIAGAFGRHLRVEQAMRIGLFPELGRERFEFLGNGSLLGARALATSQNMSSAAEAIATLMHNVELSENSLFQEEYAAAMFLPHTDSSRFPLVVGT